MQKNKRLHIELFCIVLGLLMLMLSVIGGGFKLTAKATMGFVTNVLDDLKTDENFDPEYYPAAMGIKIVDLIQLAECENGMLVAYVYQPMENAVTASSINISKTSNDSETPYFENYELVLINSSGVFFKYLVYGFEVEHSDVRYYNVSSILRRSLSSDGVLSTEIACKVGRVYEARTVGGNVKYDVQDTYVVNIIDPYHNYITFTNNENSHYFAGQPYTENNEYTDIHYIAFSTDWDIELLKSADVNYSYCEGKHIGYAVVVWVFYEEVTYGKTQKTTVTLNSDDSHIVKDKSTLFEVFDITVREYEWKKICSVDEFCEEVRNCTDYTEDEKNQICSEVAGKQWVLTFATTARTEESSLGVTSWKEIKFTKVSDVSVLRLEFDSYGVTYNLGTVSDKVSGGDYPEPTPEPKQMGFWEYIWYCIKQLFTGNANDKETVVAVIVILVVLVLIPVLTLVLSLIFPAFGVVLKVIFNGIMTGILWLFKGLWWLICLPFKGIKALINKIRGE